MAATERGQRTRLVYGGVSAEVSLVKTSGKPEEAKHDVRRMIGDRPAEEVREEALQQWQQRRRAAEAEADGARVVVETVPPGEGDPQTEAYRHLTGAPEVKTMRVEHDADPLGGGLVIDEPEPDPFAELPEERIEQGVQLDDGTFVDLTERLAKIDEATKIDGLEVIATIASNSVPRYRVRDSHWVGLAGDQRAKDKTPAKVLALLWRSLRASSDVAVVKWTKRANQALGVIVPSGRDADGSRALVLLELEWTANMRHPGPRATMPLDVEVSPREAAAALALAQALHAPPGFIDEVRDERNGQRAEVLTAAREGRLDEYAEPVEADVALNAADDLAAQLAAAAGASS